jgi:hypothetical protein
LTTGLAPPGFAACKNAMSQDPPRLPEPERPDSPLSPAQTPVPASVPRVSLPPQLLQQLQQFWRQTQPVLRAASIRSLRFTIQALEFLLKKLDEPSTVSSAPVSPVPKPSRQIESNEVPGSAEPTTTSAIPATSDRPQRAEPIRDSKPDFKPEIVEKAKILDRVKAGWQFVLIKVRSLLPVAWNEKLSDIALTGAITGTLALLLWITSASPPQNSAKVASNPVSPPAIERPVQLPIQSPTPQNLLPEITPPPELSAPEPEQPIGSSDNSKSPESPENPKSSNTEQLAPEPSPRPILNLTPEQALIAAIEDQVTEVTNEYANGLIESIQANFRNSRLTIKVGDGWYDLSSTRQDRLATEMLKRSKQLDFSAIELTDREGALLARSPVVGTEMVILQR